MAKNVYHGALRDQCSIGPVTLTIKSGPQKSKFSRPDAPKPDYATLSIGGEDFYYPLDSAQCSEFVTKHKGQTLAIVAEGSKEEAKLVAVGVPASQLQKPAAKAQPAQVHDSNPPGRPGGGPEQPVHHRNPTSETEPEQQGDTLTAVKHFIARNRVLAVLALEAAYHTKREFETAKGWELPNETFSSLFTAMLFGASANGHTAANQGIPLDLKFKAVTPQSK